MRHSRWLAPWKNSMERPVIYHCVTRVVERRLAFGPDEKEQFRTYMRMYENFSGCRVLSYCLMCNHIHLLLEVPPMKVGGLSDDELLKRLRAIYSEVFVAEVAKELVEARQQVKDGLAEESVVVARIHERFTYRMHDLSEFMRTLLLRFSRWFNKRHERTGALWESRFKSILVEEGVASKTMAAYIDLNPVRAGMVPDPANYRWSSYGEAMGGGARGNGKKARAGLVRALMAHKGYEADARLWTGCVANDYRSILLEDGKEVVEESVNATGKLKSQVVRRGIKRSVSDEEHQRLQRGQDVALTKVLRCRIRYFTDGAVIGSRGFVNEAFEGAKDRFGKRRKDGARKMRGTDPVLTGVLWSLRDLSKNSKD